MKKILFKINYFPQTSETFVTAQIITAIKCGYEVKILVKKFLNIDESNQSELFATYKFNNNIIFEDYKIPKLKFIRYLKIIQILFFNLFDVKKIYYFARKKNSFDLEKIFEYQFYKRFKNFDIIHVQFGNNHQPFEQLKKCHIINSKLIVSFHGHDAFFPIFGVLKEGYYDNLFQVVDLIVVNTSYLENQLRTIGCPTNKLITMPVGVDVSYFKPDFIKSTKGNVIQLITLGRLDKVKGHEYAIEVVEMLLKKGYEIHLTIIGEGEERSNLEKLIHQKKLQNSIRLIGKKGHKEIKELFFESDIFIFTSVAVESDRRETQGLAVVEAQASGLPVVVFDSGGVKYTLLDEVTGFVVPEYDTPKMVDKIEFLIKNDEQRTLMANQAMQFVENEYSQTILNTKWCSVYQNLIK